MQEKKEGSLNSVIEGLDRAGVTFDLLDDRYSRLEDSCVDLGGGLAACLARPEVAVRSYERRFVVCRWPSHGECRAAPSRDSMEGSPLVKGAFAPGLILRKR